PARRRVNAQLTRRVTALIKALRPRPGTVGAPEDGVVVFPLLAVAVDEPHAVGRERDVAAGAGEDLGRAERADELLPLDVEEDLVAAADADQPAAGFPVGVPADVRGERAQPRPVGPDRERHVEPPLARLEIAADEEEDAAVVAAPERVVDEEFL